MQNSWMQNAGMKVTKPKKGGTEMEETWRVKQKFWSRKTEIFWGEMSFCHFLLCATRKKKKPTRPYRRIFWEAGEGLERGSVLTCHYPSLWTRMIHRLEQQNAELYPPTVHIWLLPSKTLATRMITALPWTFILCFQSILYPASKPTRPECCGNPEHSRTGFLLSLLWPSRQ